MSDAISHPSHYRSHQSGVECIEVVRYLPACWANLVKYLWRAELKNGREDIEKATQYAGWIDLLSCQLVRHLPLAAYPKGKIMRVLEAEEQQPRVRPLTLALNTLELARIDPTRGCRHVEYLVDALAELTVDP